MTEKGVENVIEWLTGERTATLTLSQSKYKTRVKTLQKKYPDKVTVDYVNDDGTMLVYLPTSWIKINPTKHSSK